eukprot:gb/GEZN01019178.1/.p1 GENE.gb/GEZN01019178.1/~~gb/GEZN01019178.1/.p1  ORF type:complete len:222 (+),score=17.85 gb/GEZN01019178.1/:56-721(+)
MPNPVSSRMEMVADTSSEQDSLNQEDFTSDPEAPSVHVTKKAPSSKLQDWKYVCLFLLLAGFILWPFAVVQWMRPDELESHSLIYGSELNGSKWQEDKFANWVAFGNGSSHDSWRVGVMQWGHIEILGYNQTDNMFYGRITELLGDGRLLMEHFHGAFSPSHRTAYVMDENGIYNFNINNRDLWEFEYHHRDPQSKGATINLATGSWRRVSEFPDSEVQPA